MSFSLKHIYAPLPTTERAKPTLIGGDPKGKNILYCCDTSVFIRSLENPLECDQYTGHNTTTTCARYAPSGYYIASGDINGNVRIWDTTNTDHILKTEVPVFGGAVKDIAWTEDSKRLCAVGNGREKFGHPFLFDTGTSVGEITGHSKQVNSVDIKPCRPYRLVTGGEDNKVNWFEGPPFKFKKTLADHTRFVNCVRFDPKGNLFLTVGSDKKAMLYDGKTADSKGELKEGGHAGGIMCCSWNADGTQVLTCSADKTAKVWDVAQGCCVSTCTFGKDVEQQQLGCLWQGNYLVTLSFNGDLNYLDVNDMSKPCKVIKGHQKLLTSFAHHPSSNSCLTGSFDSVVTKWNMATGESTSFGKIHNNEITKLHISGDTAISCSKDDTVAITDFNAGGPGTSISMDSQPQDVNVSGDVSVCVTLDSLVVIRGKDKKSTTKVSYQPSAVAISPDASTVIVGGKDFKLRVYTLSGDNLSETAEVADHRGEIINISYSPDGNHFAACDSNREVIVFDAKTRERKVSGWVYHSARVQCIAWCPDNIHIASGSTDSNIFIWNLSAPGTRIVIKEAHRKGVYGLRWLDTNTLTSIGCDCAMKSHTITF